MTLWSCGLAESRDRLKPYFHTTTMLVAIKRGRVMTDHKELPLINSQFIILWSCGLVKSRDKTKTIVFLLLQYAWPINRAWWLRTVKLSRIKSHDPLITWSCEITWKTKPIIHNAYRHQTSKMLTFTIRMTAELSRVLTTRKRFTTQILNFSPTCCVF